jgi:hypothetical protein
MIFAWAVGAWRGASVEKWQVKADEDREQWTLTPCVGVGPLRFGMTSREVAEALAPSTVDASQRDSSIEDEKEDLPRNKHLWSPHYRPRCIRLSGLGVTTHYYGDSYRLKIVVVDALTGPQVLLDGLPLTGQVPSVLEEWFCEKTEAKGLDLRFTHEGNPASMDLGLIVRVQRAGDVVLTRPVLVVRELARDAWECLPSDELRTF